MSQIRELALELLDDGEGITQDAWPLLCEMLVDDPEGDSSDIREAVGGSEGRVYLPENHGIKTNPN